MRGKRDVLPIIIAVGVALVITGLVRWIKFGSLTSDQENRTKKELSMPDIPLMARNTKKTLGDQVLVVTNAIKKDTKITIKDLTWKKWPKDAIQPYFIARDRGGAPLNNKSDYKDAMNMWAVSDIPTGVPLSMNMLTNADPKSIEEKKRREEEERRKKEEEEKKKLQQEKDYTFIAKGMRAITFPVDQRSASSSSMLHPENLVDVLIIAMRPLSCFVLWKMSFRKRNRV
ncbi:MAG: SAF domain-containing protein [Holosporaceae bacterium]|jgi:Flp pilus assembly protein CpaB|nr:SAF domain-containing protein [Holosporaceae bacterium]